MRIPAVITFCLDILSLASSLASSLANIPPDEQKTAYFRGRKLHGQAVKLPADYRGVVGVRRDSPREQARASGTAAPEEVVDVDATAAEQEAQRQRLDTGKLDVVAEFDEIVVWGHQSLADASTDAYVRSMEEWVALSEKVRLGLLHTHSPPVHVCLYHIANDPSRYTLTNRLAICITFGVTATVFGDSLIFFLFYTYISSGTDTTLDSIEWNMPKSLLL